MDEKIKTKLKKLYALSKKGIDGEKTTAEQMLLKLLDKYGLSIKDIEQDEKKAYTYKYTTKASQDIIAQIIFSISDDVEIFVNSYKKIVIAEYLSDFEHIQVMELIEFHLNNFKKERKKILDDLLVAYIQKHNLFAKGVEAKSAEELSDEELERMYRASRLKDQLSDEVFMKKIENFSDKIYY